MLCGMWARRLCVTCRLMILHRLHSIRSRNTSRTAGGYPRCRCQIRAMSVSLPFHSTGYGLKSILDEYWAHVSPAARDFVSSCLTVDPAMRPTAAQALKHRWLAADAEYFVPGPKRKMDVKHVEDLRNSFNSRRKGFVALLCSSWDQADGETFHLQ